MYIVVEQFKLIFQELNILFHSKFTSVDLLSYHTNIITLKLPEIKYFSLIRIVAIYTELLQHFLSIRTFGALHTIYRFRNFDQHNISFVKYLYKYAKEIKLTTGTNYISTLRIDNSNLKQSEAIIILSLHTCSLMICVTSLTKRAASQTNLTLANII
jgi:hypothetical protein